MLDKDIEIKKIREKIDNIDDQIINHLIHRKKFVDQIKSYKTANKLRDSRREEEILARLSYKASLGNLDKKFIEIIYSIIFINSISQMKKNQDE